jgi:peroxiredoxin
MITPWRFAAGLGLLALAACSSSSSANRGSPPAADNTAKSGAPAPVAPPANRQAEIGKPAPDFTLTDLNGKAHKLSDYRGKPVVLEWFSPACPYCVYAYSAEGPLAEQPERLQEEGVVWLSVNSQNPKHPGADVEKNQAFVAAHEMQAPVLMDPDGVVGRAYGAKTTPHCFVIDAKGVLVYAGGLDNSPAGRPDGDAKVVNYVDAAITDLRAGKPVAIDTARAYG